MKDKKGKKRGDDDEEDMDKYLGLKNGKFSGKMKK